MIACLRLQSSWLAIQRLMPFEEQTPGRPAWIVSRL
jgi:hypothetical protein